jgi:hypothetical protein
LQTNNLKFWHKLGVPDKEFFTKNNYSLINLTIMNLFLFHSPAKNPQENTIDNMLAPIYEPLYNSNDGPEFTSDANRMIDQPLMYTEECIAAGCPEGLW